MHGTLFFLEGTLDAVVCMLLAFFGCVHWKTGDFGPYKTFSQYCAILCSGRSLNKTGAHTVFQVLDHHNKPWRSSSQPCEGAANRRLLGSRWTSPRYKRAWNKRRSARSCPIWADLGLSPLSSVFPSLVSMLRSSQAHSLGALGIVQGPEPAARLTRARALGAAAQTDA